MSRRGQPHHGLFSACHILWPQVRPTLAVVAADQARSSGTSAGLQHTEAMADHHPTRQAPTGQTSSGRLKHVRRVPVPTPEEAEPDHGSDGPVVPRRGSATYPPYLGVVPRCVTATLPIRMALDHSPVDPISCPCGSSGGVLALQPRRICGGLLKLSDCHECPKRTSQHDSATRRRTAGRNAVSAGQPISFIHYQKRIDLNF
jgi:hypothetical protein